MNRRQRRTASMIAIKDRDFVVAQRHVLDARGETIRTQAIQG
jgi:hypothetical protein